MNNEETWVALNDGDASNTGEGWIAVQKDEYGVSQSVFLTKADLQLMLSQMA